MSRTFKRDYDVVGSVTVEVSYTEEEIKDMTEEEILEMASSDLSCLATEKESNIGYFLETNVEVYEN